MKKTFLIEMEFIDDKTFEKFWNDWCEEITREIGVRYSLSISTVEIK